MFPYQIDDVEEKLNKELMSVFKGERNGFCQVGPKKWVLPVAYRDHAERYYQFQPRSDDVWIVTYPRSGTTLGQELIWLINNNFNYEMSAATPIESRFPFFEFGILHSPQFHDDVIKLNGNNPEIIEYLANWRKPGHEYLPDVASPRHIKTHLPFSLLPQNLLDVSKAVYVARNPKDVAVSYFHHNRLIKVHDYVGEFPEYWDYFEKDLLVFSPYLEHIKEGWEKRHHKNVLFLFYEDMVKDMKGTIRKVAAFLNKPITEEQVDQLANHLQIDNFRKSIVVHKKLDVQGITNNYNHGFIRKGKVGGNQEFTPELTEKANKWIAENLSKTDISFPQIPK